MATSWTTPAEPEADWFVKLRLAGPPISTIPESKGQAQAIYL
jgi:hypothetical protein